MHAPSDIPIVIVAGPTASGKSALALALAQEFDGTLINADSQQVYRDLRVLTARPSAAEEGRVPHRLYGTIDAAESCSVGRWREAAIVEIDAAKAAGRLPILVGGTGLYIEGLLKGLAELPAIPAASRDAAQALHAKLGGAAFRDELAKLDPEAAAKLVPGDTQRLTRAYEVAIATGRSLTEWQRHPVATPAFKAGAIVLLPERAGLNPALDARVERMMAAGAVDEVRALLARGLAPELPAMKAVGVREIGAWLAGNTTREAAIAAMQQATRRYAKRQYTWFGHRLNETESLQNQVVKEQFSESLLPNIFSFIRAFLLTHPV